jgi:hypothetical protein
MSRLREYVARLKSINQKTIDDGVLKIVQETKNQAIDLNTKQLFAGRDANGQSLGGYRNENYAAFKRSLNPAGVVDLKLTGDFHSSFFAKTDSFPIAFDATDEKTSELKQKYGEIFGLDETSLEEYREEVKPLAQDFFHELLSP